MFCREQCVVPVEKRKKGKRKRDAPQEAAESDDTASLCTLATGGEESTDPMDNIVSTPTDVSVFILHSILSVHFVLGFYSFAFYCVCMKVHAEI